MISLEPIGTVKNTRLRVEDDNWGGLVSTIELCPPYDEDSLKGIEDFSHVEIIFFFHQVNEGKIVNGARHPRNNTDWPLTGIFAQRGKNRPNRIGITIAKLIKSDGVQLFIKGLDAINGTPVLDIKPVMREFLPDDEVRQPAWADEIMRHYWQVDKK
jgi:tRNA-Thr(GGU) m(6)t(6)A37 methyltransferase TsaA